MNDIQISDRNNHPEQGGLDFGAPTDDEVLPFLLENSGIRGRYARLGPALDTLLTRTAHPDSVAHLLGELATLCVVLGAMLKYQGVFTLQIKGDGALSTLVVDLTSDGVLRGYANYDAEKLAELPELGEVEDPIATYLGKGYLAFTVDQGEHAQRYQGMVELSGPKLSDGLLQYFRQSQQISAGLLVEVAKVNGHWRSGALLIEELPDQTREVHGEDATEHWRRSMVLMSSCTSEELLDPDLSHRRLVYRLFHEEGLRVFEQTPITFGCRCSRDRVATILQSLDASEMGELKNDEGQVEVGCEFCNARYLFGDEDIAVIFTPEES